VPQGSHYWRASRAVALGVSPFLYAVCAAEDARVHFAEEAGRLLELYAKLGHKQRNVALTVLQGLALVSQKADDDEVSA
jgi:hypothetical protein